VRRNWTTYYLVSCGNTVSLVVLPCCDLIALLLVIIVQSICRTVMGVSRHSHLETVFSLFWSWWSVSRSWSCHYCLYLVSRPRQFKTSDGWWDASLETHCHYQLVDVQRFCHLIRFHHFGHICRLLLATNRKRMKRIYEDSWSVYFLPKWMRYCKWLKWWEVSWRYLLLIFSLSWSYLDLEGLGTYCLGPIPAAQ